MMSSFVLLLGQLIALIQTAPGGAQAEQNAVMFAPIMRTERAGAGVVRIVYDLNGAAVALFSVALEVSNDGGQSFTVRASALTGDVGPGVSAGSDKVIVWDSAKDIEDLQIERIVFRVRVTQGGSSGMPEPASPPKAVPPAGGAPAGTGSGGGTTSAAKRGGGLSKGAIAALVGGGAAAAGIAATKSGGGSSSSSPSANQTTPTTPSAVSRTFTASLSGAMTVNFQALSCLRSATLTGSLVLNLQIGSDGRVTGTAAINGTNTDTAATASSCAVPAGTTSAFGAAGAVTGSTGSIAFRSTATNTAPPASTNTQDYTFAGSLASDVVTGTLTYVRLIEPGNGSGTVIFPITAR